MDSNRTVTRVAWSVCALAVGLMAAGFFLHFLNKTDGVGGGDFTLVVGLSLSVLGYTTVGALIGARLPRNSIAWLFCSVGLGMALLLFSFNYAVYGLDTSPGSLPGSVAAAWVSNVLPGFLLPALPLLLLLFPNGEPISRRWRWVGWGAVAGGALVALGFLGNSSKGITGDRLELVAPGWASSIPGIRSFLVWGGILLFVAAMASLLAVVRRFRRSRGDERQQLKWPAYVSGVTGVAFLLANLVGWLPLVGDIAWAVGPAAIAIGIPGACGIAILRYRLYDLDIVVKKTVVFALVAAFITAVYVLIVVAVPTLILELGAGAGFSPLTLITTILVALAFQPVRSRARRLADRIVYGKRATPYEVLSEFSDRIAGAYSAEDVLPRMAMIAASGTGATSARVWLRIGADLRPAAALPEGCRNPRFSS